MSWEFYSLYSVLHTTSVLYIYMYTVLYIYMYMYNVHVQCMYSTVEPPLYADWVWSLLSLSLPWTACNMHVHVHVHVEGVHVLLII